MCVCVCLLKKNYKCEKFIFKKKEGNNRDTHLHSNENGLGVNGWYKMDKFVIFQVG